MTALTTSALAADGSTVDLKVPSEKIQVNQTFTVRADEHALAILVFDLDRSILQAGESGQWIFKPVVRVEVRQVPTGTAGATGAATAPNTTAALATGGTGAYA